MKDFFNMNDFFHGISTQLVAYECAKIANKKLNALIEQAPVVYGYHVNGKFRYDENKHPAFDTHKARLIMIEDVVKEPCKHEPKVKDLLNPQRLEYVCKHCGAELRATWEAK